MHNGSYNLVIAPDDYPGVKYRNRYCSEHYAVIWNTLHKLPQKNEIIHHIDGNKRNNSIDNLQIMDKSEHKSMHSKQHGITKVLLKYPWCEKEFEMDKNKSFISKHGKFNCCSKECLQKILSLRHTNIELYNERISECFIKEYKVYP